MWELDYKESLAPKNWCFWTAVLAKTLESPLDCKKIQPVYPKGNQSWIFIGRTDAEAETPILWPPGAKNWPFGKNPDAGKDWRCKARPRGLWWAAPPLSPAGRGEVPNSRSLPDPGDQWQHTSPPKVAPPQPGRRTCQPTTPRPGDLSEPLSI